jgi:hypothetical protein
MAIELSNTQQLHTPVLGESAAINALQPDDTAPMARELHRGSRADFILLACGVVGIVIGFVLFKHYRDMETSLRASEA